MCRRPPMSTGPLKSPCEANGAGTAVPWAASRAAVTSWSVRTPPTIAQSMLRGIPKQRKPIDARMSLSEHYAPVSSQADGSGHSAAIEAEADMWVHSPDTFRRGQRTLYADDPLTEVAT